MFRFDTINIILSFVVLIYLFITLLLIKRGNNKKVSYSFAAVLVSVMAWTLAMIVYRYVSPENTLFWCRILYIAATFTASTFLIFSYIFPYGQLPNRKIIFGTSLLNLIIILLVIIPNFIIKNTEVIPGQEKIIHWGPGYIFYFLYISGLFSTGLFLLFKKYTRAEGVIKQQIKYIFGGYLLASNLGMLTNLLLVWWGDFRFNWLGQVFSMFLGVFIVYTIIAHRLMDIKVVLRKYSVYIASILVIAIPSIVVSYYSDKFFSEYTTYINLIILVLAISVFTSVRNSFYHFANKYLFSSLYDSNEVIAYFGEKLRSIIDIDKIYHLISDTVINTLHSKSVGILNYDEKTGKYKIKFNNGFNVGGQETFPGDKELHELFTRQSKSIITEEIKTAAYEEHKEILDMLNKLGVALIVPLNIKDETLGVIALGPKEAKDMYNSEDLRTLEIIASQAAISIKNAQLYEETRKFSMTLQKEVERQTAELKRANEDLQILDQAKSKFISIASHQLRTPLTAIKGYISLMREGTYGKMTKKMEHPLENVYLSNERLIRLVNDLLNVSRIEAGKIEVVREKASVEDIISSIIEELQNIAKSKKLTVEWVKPETALPKVSVDINKIRNAIFNIVDNGIRYTEQGGITISTQLVDGKLQIRIKDTGPGIEKKELEKLFSTFSRGAAGVESHTEGTGLGLYIAKSFVGMHNGKIWAESEGLGKGSTFIIELPII